MGKNVDSSIGRWVVNPSRDGSVLWVCWQDRASTRHKWRRASIALVVKLDEVEGLQAALASAVATASESAAKEGA